MKTSTKSMKAEAQTIEATAASLFNKGFERAVEVSKISLDLALEQNTEFLASCKQALKASYMPSAFLFDCAGQAFESYVTVQKHLLDFAVEQSASVMEAAQEYSFDIGEAESITHQLVEQTLDRTIAAEKMVLDTTTRTKPKR